MLIVLGGLPASGRKSMARALAERHRLYSYDIDRKKLRTPILDKDGDFQVRHPSTDQESLRVYRDALAEFPKLSKMYSDVIVSDIFHREVPRNYFLQEAKSYYTPAVFVWMERDTQLARLRLEQLHERGVVSNVAAALRRREHAERELQLPDDSALRFSCGDVDDTQVAALWALIQKAADRSAR